MDVIQRVKALTILQHYGAANQRRQLVEECSELIQAICKYDRAISSNTTGYYPDVQNAKYNIAGEIADVLIMIEQIKISLGTETRQEIENLIESKLNRQLERIKEENKRG